MCKRNHPEILKTQPCTVLGSKLMVISQSSHPWSRGRGRLDRSTRGGKIWWSPIKRLDEALQGSVLSVSGWFFLYMSKVDLVEYTETTSWVRFPRYRVGKRKLGIWSAVLPWSEDTWLMMSCTEVCRVYYLICTTRSSWITMVYSEYDQNCCITGTVWPCPRSTVRTDLS